MTAQKRRSRVSSLLAITTTALVAVTGALAVPAVAQAAEITSAPAVEVSQDAGISPYGQTVTVKGSGFLPSTPDTDAKYPPLQPAPPAAPVAGKFGGAYVVFGSFAENWRPSEGAPRTARKVFSQKWAVSGVDVEKVGGAAAGAVELKEDGTFETTLTLTKDDASALADGRYGIYTYAAGGATYAPFETYTPVSFAPKATAKASVTSASNTGLQVKVDATDLPGDIYGAMFVKGTEGELTDQNSPNYIAFALPFPTVLDGKASFTLTAPKAKLKRGTEYEVVIWKQHGTTEPQNIYARAAVTISDLQWDAVALPYTDVKLTDTHFKGINWMYKEGYAASAPKFNPANSMTRGAMSTMLQRIHEPNYKPSANLKLPFGDVKPGDTHYKGIAWMWENGYAAKAAKFNPANSVTRGAMATFMQRLEAPKYQPSQGLTLPYSDVKKGDTHYRGIAWMRESGNAAPAAKYYAANATTRGAMATFLMRIYS